MRKLTASAEATGVGVVLVNWNGAEDTIPCIRSLLAGSAKPDRVVVVDNASSDGSAGLIERAFPGVELIRNGENAGFTGANNIGIGRLLSSGCDYVWVLNNDTTVHEDCLRTLKGHMEAHSEVSACSGKILYDEPARMIWYAGATYNPWTMRPRHRGGGEEDNARYDAVENVPFLSGCCMFVRREAFERVGLFDDHFFAYGEDSDWCLRASREHMRLHYVPQAVIRHKVSASFRKKNLHSHGGTTSPLAIYATSRNRLYIIRKHRKGMAQMLSALFTAATWYCYYGMALLVLRRKEKLGALARGVYDGIRGPLAQPDRTMLRRYLK